VWGDFDVDGQTSTTILFQTLKELGADVSFHIPIRERESHGVNLPILQEIIDHGAQLILTCDTGITAHAAADYANTRRVDMIITDHHDLPASLPSAIAVVNPKLLSEEHPLYTLSGSGVAYKLSEELYRRYGRSDEAVHQVDLAALGLVGDMARLTGDARYLVQLGLVELSQTRRLGLQIMMEMAELIPANLTEEHIGFVLGPRLNALGRLGDANPAVELLTTSDPVRARVLATQLEGLNSQRQMLCNQVTRAAEAQLHADPALLAQPVLVLAHPSWPGGVVGIVASRLVERYQKPAILFSIPAGEPARGSARSVDGLNITAAIAAQKELLLNFGGHPMAAGLALQQEKLPEFTRRLAKTVDEMQGTASTEHNLEIDGWIALPEINLQLAEALESLAPFGPGNEKLVLATHALKTQSVATLGRNGEHLKLKVMDETGNSQTVFWWNGAEEKDSLPQGSFDLAFSLRASDWRGKAQVQMELADFRNLEPEKIEVARTELEIIDYRNVDQPLKILSSLLKESPTEVWADGEEKKQVRGKGRFELAAADALAIWTIPPSPRELQLVLEIVQPRKIYLFAVTLPDKTPDPFLERLAGLLKYAINHRTGRISYLELETATAQRSITVRNGIKLLVALGKINIQAKNEEEIIVASETSSKDPEEASRLLAELKSLLAETAAYRSHFKFADKDILFS
jgi:single-stranded-DNA-specific exonuclease